MLPRLAELGASLAAVSPQTLENTQATAEKGEITFLMLSDPGNELAANFGLVFEMPEDLRTVYKSFGTDVAAANGDESFGLPIPATYIIDRDRTIKFAFVAADYTKRAEPEDVLRALEKIVRG